MPRVKYLTTLYECPACRQRVRDRRGKTMKCARHRNDEFPVEMMDTVIGPRPRLNHQPYEPTLVDIGQVPDKSAPLASKAIWMAAPLLESEGEE